MMDSANLSSHREPRMQMTQYQDKLQDEINKYLHSQNKNICSFELVPQPCLYNAYICIYIYIYIYEVNDEGLPGFIIIRFFKDTTGKSSQV